MQLDKDGNITDVDLHDAELTTLSFDDAGALITFVLHSGGSFVIRLLNVRWIHLESDCTQNIIEGVSISQDLSRVATRIPAVMLEALSIWHNAKPLTVVAVRPIAGADLFAIADGVETTELTHEERLLFGNRTLAWQIGKQCRQLNDLRFSTNTALEDAVMSLATEFWDQGFSQTEITQGLKRAMDDLNRYAAGEERRT